MPFHLKYVIKIVLFQRIKTFQLPSPPATLPLMCTCYYNTSAAQFAATDQSQIALPVKLNLDKKLNPKQKTIQAFNIDA